MLTEEQLNFYDANGYLLVKGMFSRAEAAALRAEAHDLIQRLSAQRSVEATWGSARQLNPGGQQTVLQHCHDVQFYLASFARLLLDERLTGAAAEIIGSATGVFTGNVQLHHNKLFIKPPEKGSPFPMHQDHPYFPHANHSMIAAILHMDDAPLEKGCVRVVPGSHKLGPLPHDPQGSFHLPLDEYPLESAVPCPAEAGDVLFFSYLTIHGSGVNTSSEARTTILVQMRDPADWQTNQAHQSRGQGTILRGVDPLVVKATAAQSAMG
jgi:ectoine hydroxylase-related dioxygenase (phytanoyl-CoA dioxygenase family)